LQNVTDGCNITDACKRVLIYGKCYPKYKMMPEYAKWYLCLQDCTDTCKIASACKLLAIFVKWYASLQNDIDRGRNVTDAAKYCIQMQNYTLSVQNSIEPAKYH
jgi:hypothetical protein